jgi:WD40 repeat protein
MHVNVYDVYVDVCIAKQSVYSLIWFIVACSAHGNAVATLSGHVSWVLSVACSPDGTQFATGYVSKTALLHDRHERLTLLLLFL